MVATPRSVHVPFGGLVEFAGRGKLEAFLILFDQTGKAQAALRIGIEARVVAVFVEPCEGSVLRSDGLRQWFLDR